ncbi:MAG: hypothetical protein A07HR60_02359 [uncultured archaeon A07HR60]|nr:MAG: hypothetical protein A07HR60_02359 [uncultured archaeon A07HR60]
MRKIVNRSLETAETDDVDVADLSDVEDVLRVTMQKIGEYGAEKLADECDVGWRQPDSAFCKTGGSQER